MIQRFKNRCEWHDAERLRWIAEGARRSKEDLLTAEFAKYLFDQGLDPLSRPRTAGLEPDILSIARQSRLYVEAKQYGDEDPSRIRKRIKNATRQILDTVGRLRGTAFEPWEAVLLIFRHGGPRLILPERLEVEGTSLIPVLVDIAPASKSGSRQRQPPIIIKEEDLLPRSNK